VAKKTAPKKTSAKKAAPKKAVAKKTAPAKKPAIKVVSRNAAPVKSKKPAPKTGKESNVKNLQEFMRDKVLQVLDDGKAEDTMCIDVRGQSPICDFLVITTGRSSRAVNALSDAVVKGLIQSGAKNVRSEGKSAGDWSVVDGGDVIVHIFRPEVRAFYRLEEVWGLEPPLQQTFRDL
jgi:ribosome-associated protein